MASQDGDGACGQADASKDLCEKLAKCKDPVCFNYYNDPDVERICGICTMAASGWFGCFAGHSQAAAPRHTHESCVMCRHTRVKGAEEASVRRMSR